MMKSKSIIIKSLFTLFLFIFSLLPKNVNAITPAFYGRYSQGVSNVAIWLNYGSGVGYWESYIVNARNNWLRPGWANDIGSMPFVNSNYGSKMDFHLQNNSFWWMYPPNSVLAQTKFYNSSGQQIDPNSGNWFFAEIHINHDAYSQPSVSNDAALGTTIHEMGHAFGLAHDNNNPYSIMCQTGYGRIVQRVQWVDNEALNRKY